MKAEDLGKSLEYLLDALMTWFAAVRSPSATCATILAETDAESEGIKKTIKLWITSFVLNVFVQAWVYQLYGIGATNIVFHLSLGLVLFVVLLCVVFFIDFGLKLFKLPGSFKETFVVFTVFVSLYAPVFGFLTAPTLALTLDILKTIKASNADISSAFSMFHNLMAQQQQSVIGMIGAVGTTVLTVFSLFIISRVFEVLAYRRSLERPRVYSAGSLGMIIAVAPIALLTSFQFAVMYAFLGSK